MYYNQNAVLIKSDWEDYFQGFSIDQNYTGKINGQGLYQQGNFHFKDCFIEDNEGSGIYIDLQNSTEHNDKTLIEYCMFANCTAVTNGGAVNFFSMNGEFIVHHSCCVKCTCNLDAHFIYSCVSSENNKDNRNYLLDSGSTQSIREENEHVIHFKCGSIKYERVNSSFNRIQYHAGITIDPSFQDPQVGLISYCSISNNTAMNGIILSIFADSIIDSCNILYNTQYEETDGIVHAIENTNATIKNTCILGNNGYPMIKNKSEYVLTLYNCTVYLNMDCVKGHLFKEGNIEMIDMPYITTRFLHQLSFISTGDCQSSFEKVDLYSPSNCIYPTPITPYPILNYILSHIICIGLLCNSF